MTEVISINHHYVSDTARQIQDPNVDCLFTLPKNAQKCMAGYVHRLENNFLYNNNNILF